jgi:Zn-dependent M28 family amino/carboxypeptidase
MNCWNELLDHLEETDVEVILFSGEELGAEGSAQYVKVRFPEHGMLPSYVINLDPIGASSRLAVTGDDRRLFRSYRPDPQIVAGLGSVFRQITNSPLNLTSRGGTTDAVSFEARGIPAATLISEVPPFIIPRGMHTANDKRSRIDLSSLDLTKELIVRFAQEADAKGMNF